MRSNTYIPNLIHTFFKIRVKFLSKMYEQTTRKTRYQNRRKPWVERDTIFWRDGFHPAQLRTYEIKRTYLNCLSSCSLALFLRISSIRLKVNLRASSLVRSLSTAFQTAFHTCPATLPERSVRTCQGDAGGF